MCIIVFRSRFLIWGSRSWRDDDSGYNRFGGVHSCTVFVRIYVSANAYHRFTDEYFCINIFRCRFLVWGSRIRRDDDSRDCSFGGAHSCIIFIRIYVSANAYYCFTD